MSMLQPARRPARKSPAAIRHARATPTTANVVDAIEALHEDIITNQKYQRSVNTYLENGVNALLDHFKIPRPKV